MTPLNFLIKPTTVYRFAELMQMPYKQFEAYRKGIIDENGRIISNQSGMDGLEYIVIRLRSLFKELMPGSNRYFLQTLSGTLKLFSEEFEMMNLDRNDINLVMEAYLIDSTHGELSYLDYLLEEAQTRYISEEMGAAMVSAAATPNLQGGLAGYDRPMTPMLRRHPKKRLKKSHKMVIEQMAQAPQPTPSNPYLPLQVDPVNYDEIFRSLSPSGELDYDQLTTPELKKYLKRLSERTGGKQVYIIGNQQQPPRALSFLQKGKRAR
jgi:hypothetical protein